MPLEKVPSLKAAWPPLAANDALKREPEAYPLGRVKGESFLKIAGDKKLNGMDLIQYNFRTRDPLEINWYLRNYVGCKQTTPDGKNFSFEGLVHEPAKNKGVIFIPKGAAAAPAPAPISDFNNRWGEQVVADYLAGKKEISCACYDAVYRRVSAAAKKVGVQNLPALSTSSATDFYRLWVSLYVPESKWFALPVDYRGKGAAGALASVGLGELVDDTGIWAGKLKPGAAMQAWTITEDYTNLRDWAIKPQLTGHSFIFIDYIRDGSGITGIKSANQYGTAEFRRGRYDFWVGANLKVA